MTEVRRPGEAEYELLQEFVELSDTPRSAERDARFTAALRAAEDGDLVNALLMGQLLQTYDAVLEGDLDGLVGALARTEQTWSEHRHRLADYVVMPLLVQYVAVLFAVLRRPAVPLARIEAIAATLERRCREHGVPAGESMRVRMICADRRGADEESERWFRSWRAEPPTEGFPEFAESGITWLTRRRDYAGAVALFDEAMIRTEDPAVRGMLLAAVLEPLVGLGRLEDAARRHHEGLRHALDAPQLGQHLAYLAVTGELLPDPDVRPENEPEAESEGESEAESESGRPRARLARTLPRIEAMTGGAALEFAAYTIPLLRRLRSADRGAEVLSEEAVPGIDGPAGVDAVFARLVALAEEQAGEVDRVNDLDGLTMRRLHRFWAEH